LSWKQATQKQFIQLSYASQRLPDCLIIKAIRKYQKGKRKEISTMFCASQAS
jgi:hypothetical protein